MAPGGSRRPTKRVAVVRLVVEHPRAGSAVSPSVRPAPADAEQAAGPAPPREPPTRRRAGHSGAGRGRQSPSFSSGRSSAHREVVTTCATVMAARLDGSDGTAGAWEQQRDGAAAPDEMRYCVADRPATGPSTVRDRTTLDLPGRRRRLGLARRRAPDAHRLQPRQHPHQRWPRLRSWPPRRRASGAVGEAVCSTH